MTLVQDHMVDVGFVTFLDQRLKSNHVVLNTISWRGLENLEIRLLRYQIGTHFYCANYVTLRYTRCSSELTLWFQLEDTVLLISTLLLFDPFFYFPFL